MSVVDIIKGKIEMYEQEIAVGGPLWMRLREAKDFFEAVEDEYSDAVVAHRQWCTVLEAVDAFGGPKEPEEEPEEPEEEPEEPEEEPEEDAPPPNAPYFGTEAWPCKCNDCTNTQVWVKE